MRNLINSFQVFKTGFCRKTLINNNCGNRSNWLCIEKLTEAIILFNNDFAAPEVYFGPVTALVRILIKMRRTQTDLLHSHAPKCRTSGFRNRPHACKCLYELAPWKL